MHVRTVYGSLRSTEKDMRQRSKSKPGGIFLKHSWFVVPLDVDISTSSRPRQALRWGTRKERTMTVRSPGVLVLIIVMLWLLAATIQLQAAGTRFYAIQRLYPRRIGW